MNDLEYRIQHLEKRLQELCALETLTVEQVRESFKAYLDPVSKALWEAKKELHAEEKARDEYTDKEEARYYVKRLCDEAHEKGIRRAAEE